MDLSAIAALTLGGYVTWTGLMALTHPPAFILFHDMFITANQYRFGAMIATTFQLVLLWIVFVS